MMMGVEGQIRRRVLAGGPGRTRTCNQTVMSGRISTRFVDFAVFSFAFDCVCCVLARSFLVRNGAAALQLSVASQRLISCQNVSVILLRRGGRSGSNPQ